MEVSFFSDQNSPKNFSQKCKKIPLPTLTFSSDIMPPQSQIDSMHSMLSILWQCRFLSNFFTRPITTIGLYIYYCLFQDHFLPSSKWWWHAYGIWASTEVMQQNDKLLEDNILSYCTFVHSLQCKKNMVTFVYNFKPL